MVDSMQMITGEYPVYPGHPLVIAYQIMAVFPTPSSALQMDTSGGLNCHKAVSDQRISGGGGELNAACTLLAKAIGGTAADELIAWADERWVSSQAGGHAKSVAPGLSQAEKLKPQFPQKLQHWMVTESSNEAPIP